MKRWLSILIASILLIALFTPVMAAPKKHANGHRIIFSLVGKIEAIDATSGTVTINVLRGNNPVQPYFGKQLTVGASTATRYLYKASPTAVPVPITFVDLKVGDSVSVNGTLANTVWTASRITVGANLIHYP